MQNIQQEILENKNHIHKPLDFTPFYQNKKNVTNQPFEQFFPVSLCYIVLGEQREP